MNRLMVFLEMSQHIVKSALLSWSYIRGGFPQFSLTSFNLFTNVSILIDAQSIEHHTVAPYTKASFLFLLEWDESSSERTWLFVWAYLTVSVLFREREEERGDEEEEKGGPYCRNHYAA